MYLYSETLCVSQQEGKEVTMIPIQLRPHGHAICLFLYATFISVCLCSLDVSPDAIQAHITSPDVYGRMVRVVQGGRRRPHAACPASGPLLKPPTGSRRVGRGRP
jgi:hypothetical protein